MIHTSSEALAAELDRQICQPIAEHILARSSYRRSRSTWVGGNHCVGVRLGPYPSCSGKSVTVWNGKHTWRGTNSKLSFQITRRALDLLGADGIVIAGLATLDVEPVGPREYRAVWAEQSRGFGLRPRCGWLIRGYHSTRSTLALARADAASARRRALSTALARRADRRVCRNLYVSLEDSIRAGNCAIATRAFAARVWRVLGSEEECAVRADVVMDQARQAGMLLYASRAVAAAQTRRSQLKALEASAIAGV